MPAASLLGRAPWTGGTTTGGTTTGGTTEHHLRIGLSSTSAPLLGAISKGLRIHPWWRLPTVALQPGFPGPRGAGTWAHESDHELVDLLDITPDRMLDLVGRPGGPLADATLWHLEVVEAGALTPTLYRVVLTAPGLDGLHYMPGQDLMLRVPLGSDRVVNRRYTIRSFDATRAAVFIDVSLHGGDLGRIGYAEPESVIRSRQLADVAKSRCAKTLTGICRGGRDSSCLERSR